MSTVAVTNLKHESATGNNIILDSSGNAAFADGSASTPSITNDGDLNTGIFFPGADRIGFAEGGAQCGEFDASGNFQFNSGYGSVATAYGCRAWVNFNGTGVVAIRASGNVSSITDNGTGDYTVNFTTAMPDANYSSAGQSQGIVLFQGTSSTTAYRVNTYTFAGTLTDYGTVNIAIFR